MNITRIINVHKTNISIINERLGHLKRRHVELICFIQDIERNFENVKVGKDERFREKNVINGKAEVIDKQQDLLDSIPLIYGKSKTIFIPTPISYDFSRSNHRQPKNMVLFKTVNFLKDAKTINLHDLNLDNLKRVMDQNQFNTVLVDYINHRFLFYDCIDHVADKYNLYDLNVLSNSKELFDTIVLLKYDENKIKNKSDLFEIKRRDCGLLTLKTNFCNTIDDINLCDINEDQQEEKQINFDKTILQFDDNVSCRPTFNAIIKLNDVQIAFADDLEDDECDEINSDRQTENDVNKKEEIIQYDVNYLSVPIDQDTSETVNVNVFRPYEQDIINSIMNLSKSIKSLEASFNNRLNNLDEKLSSLAYNVDKRLCNMENNINLEGVGVDMRK
ncbi:unnamed protein product [Rotaria magnacalcarata]|uniref:Uncharacterized protein n=3 Tax=Rotaria magnacalcarata TaxID=392030 RepID=A0A8S2MPP8_9BILA|nr:unnamed protein product [Rotaria magnacalcarata]